MAREGWRTPESYEAEAVTRGLVKPLLISRGFKVLHEDRKPAGGGSSQILDLIHPDGRQIKARVKTCWRWSKGRRKRNSSAAQLTNKYKISFEHTLEAIVNRNRKAGVTHLLLVQADEKSIVYAALLPIGQLPLVWDKQRTTSIRVINEGRMGRIKKNHAENGDSPTIWLMDTRAEGGKEVCDVFWNWPGVTDIVGLPEVAASNQAEAQVDDTYDDLPEVDPALLGSENAPRKQTTRSEVKRDPQVRRAVAKRATEGCERPGCEDTRTYPGFLDVHHILGVEKSDRLWTCVALCPNCHREAHYSPERDALNAELLEYAKQFEPPKLKAA